jgi:methylisocitrate lyase
MTTDTGTQLRNEIQTDGITVFPGAYDVLSALLAQEAGFDAVFTSGFSISVTRLGYPDMGFMERGENLDAVAPIAEALDVPLVADMDTGYGNVLNVQRTIQDCLDAGIAGVILEDQEWPKKCGHMDEKRVIPADEHARRIKAAADVRDASDRDLIIIARTDAREPNGLEEALDRARLYREAGGDVLFVEAPESREELETITSELDAPTFANMVKGGKTPYLNRDELDEIGFDIVVFPLEAIFSVARTLKQVYGNLREDGTPGDTDRMDFDEFDQLIEADDYRDVVHQYAEQFQDS